MKGIYFISGIDTNIGKSIATGWLAGQLLNQNVKVITQKLVQTGNKEYSEDIELHRKIMKINMFPEDISKLTAPVIFSYPSSPHLAAKIDKKELDIDAITLSSKILKERYDVVLIRRCRRAHGPPYSRFTDDRLHIPTKLSHNISDFR